jgi:mannitol-1-phosphate 5-dehydrogenase
MALSGNRTFVGFGFGAIQAGLFLHEAFHSGAFRNLVVAEVMPEVVQSLRVSGGWACVNIAYHDGVQVSRLGPVEVVDPGCPQDRMLLIESIAAAEEIATAVPSVRHYASGLPGSIDRMLAEGLRRKAERKGPRAVVYAAENHNHAAEILEASVLEQIPHGEHESVRSRVRFLNTVIGKMSGVTGISGEDDLVPITPSLGRAFLVEAFNRILISRISFGAEPGVPEFRRGIAVFEEKPDLLPFEEAKLYGHNATHALGCYLGAIRGVSRIADLADFPDMMHFLEQAFTAESGEGLIRKHPGVDPLFTPEGYRAYAEDLLRRMTNPFLRDTVERVGRDLERKLGWDDRLVGTVRMALRQGLVPVRYALGIAAALEVAGCATNPAAFLDRVWAASLPDTAERAAVLKLVDEARQRLQIWREAGFPPLDRL